MDNKETKSLANFCGQTRREFIGNIAGGFASVALTGILSSDGFLNSQAFAEDGITPYENPLAPKPSHFTSKAKHVIFLFMYGGPSHVDTFDYKPKLFELNDKTVQVKTKGRGGERSQGRIVGPKWNFKQYGESGQWVSGLFPNIATCVDDIAFIKSMTCTAIGISDHCLSQHCVLPSEFQTTV